MSRCGSCPLYDNEVYGYGCSCSGNLGVEECADTLQGLYHAMDSYIGSLKVDLAKKIKEAKEAKEQLNAVLSAPLVGCHEDGYPNEFTMFGEFQFIGKNGSMGLQNGAIYALTIKRKGPSDPVWAYWGSKQCRASCPYTNMALFKKNWRWLKLPG